MSVDVKYDTKADHTVYTFSVDALSGSSCGSPKSLSVRCVGPRPSSRRRVTGKRSLSELRGGATWEGGN